MIRNLCLALAIMLIMAACESGLGGDSVKMTTVQDSIAYAIGQSVAQDLKNNGVELDSEELLKGIKETMDGTLTLERDEIMSRLQKYNGLIQQRTVTGDSTLNIPIDSLSYILGSNIGNGVGELGLDYQPELIAAGCSDVVDESGAFEEGTLKSVLGKLQQEQRAAFQKKQEEDAKQNEAEGLAFLAENKGKEGVMETASGLQYKVLRAGQGAKPAQTDTVEVHYEGRLLNGDVFDSSYERGETIKFPLNRVIAGWTEGLQLMNPGAKYQLYIPHQLGYGERGSPPNIGPKATLVFDVELMSFTKASK